MSLKNRIKEATLGTPYYNAVRNIYQFIFNRPQWNYRKQLRNWFSQFVSKDDLVFDVGANRGDYAELFSALGARVIAVEPNPQLVTKLRTLRPSTRITVEPVGVGSKEGTAELFLSNADALSSLSHEWIEVAKKSERFVGYEWNEKVVINVTTLDALIAKYGMPRFIKIDVEGFEIEALRGLSQRPEYLSFEFNTEFVSAAEACVSSASFGDGSQFNIVFGQATDFALKQWVSHQEIVDIIRGPQFHERKMYGDIYVRNSDRQ